MTSMPPTMTQTTGKSAEEIGEKIVAAFKDAGVQVKERTTTMAKNKYLVRYAGKDITVYADKVGTGDGLYFWVRKSDDLTTFDLIAHFPAGAAFNLAEDVDPRPAPVKGVDYYSLEDLRRALNDIGYMFPDTVVDKVRQRVSVRNDGRYTIDELKTAVKQTSLSAGSYYAEQFDKAALQARKNRVFDAHTR